MVKLLSQLVIFFLTNFKKPKSELIQITFDIIKFNKKIPKNILLFFFRIKIKNLKKITIYKTKNKINGKTLKELSEKK